MTRFPTLSVRILVQTRLVLKRPQRALNRRTLDRYHRALDSWSQRALDRVSECSTLLSDSEGPGLVSKDLEPVLEGLGHGLRRPWSQWRSQDFLKEGSDVHGGPNVPPTKN